MIQVARLVPELLEILRQANEESLTPQEKCDKRKVIVFSYFADTAKWIADYLSDALAEDHRLADYRYRMTCVRGMRGLHGREPGAGRLWIRANFLRSATGSDEDRFDILVTTDVLAEGVNLQQARHIINYDLPWNPMRLVQSMGELTELVAHIATFILRCFFPDRRLEDLLSWNGASVQSLTTAARKVGVEAR